MRFPARILGCSALFLAGCGLAHNAAVGSYNIATAPIRLFHHPSPTPAVIPPGTTVTTTHTEVKRPKHPSPKPSPVTALEGHRPTHYVAASTSPTPRSKKKPLLAATPKPGGAVTAEAASTEQNFPTAKAVPDRPGYVFSPSEPGKYVDVSGYAPGSKVKDPYSGKIFLVP